MGAPPFEKLSDLPPGLLDDERRLFASLPIGETLTEVKYENEPAARRLERRGLIKLEQRKTNPISIWVTCFAGRLPVAKTRP